MNDIALHFHARLHFGGMIGGSTADSIQAVGINIEVDLYMALKPASADQGSSHSPQPQHAEPSAWLVTLAGLAQSRSVGPSDPSLILARLLQPSFFGPVSPAVGVVARSGSDKWWGPGLGPGPGPGPTAPDVCGGGVWVKVSEVWVWWGMGSWRVEYGVWCGC